jgi:hypothetical protein
MTNQLTAILQKQDLTRLSGIFDKEGINDSILHILTEDDLEKIGINQLGVRKRLLKEFREVQTQMEFDSSPRQAPHADYVGSNVSPETSISVDMLVEEILRLEKPAPTLMASFYRSEADRLKKLFAQGPIIPWVHSGDAASLRQKLEIGTVSMPQEAKKQIQINLLNSLIDVIENSDGTDPLAPMIIESECIGRLLYRSSVAGKYGELPEDVALIIDRACNVLNNQSIPNILTSDAAPELLALLSCYTIPGEVSICSPENHYRILERFVETCPSDRLAQDTIRGMYKLKGGFSDYALLDKLILECQNKIPAAQKVKPDAELVIFNTTCEDYEVCDEPLTTIDFQGHIATRLGADFQPFQTPGSPWNYDAVSFKDFLGNEPELKAFFKSIEKDYPFSTPVILIVPCIPAFLNTLCICPKLMHNLKSVDLCLDYPELVQLVSTDPHSLFSLYEINGCGIDCELNENRPEGVTESQSEVHFGYEITGAALQRLFGRNLGIIFESGERY